MAAALAGVMALLGCGDVDVDVDERRADAGDRPADTVDERPTGGQPSPAVPANVFLPEAIHPGDTILGLEVVAVDLSPAVGEDSIFVGTVGFAGPVRLVGDYRPHPLGDESDAACLFPDAASSELLPRLPHDERYSWLCFSNRDDARRLLGEPDGREVTVIVDDYSYAWSRTDVHNEARLVAVEGGGDGP